LGLLIARFSVAFRSSWRLCTERISLRVCCEDGIEITAGETRKRSATSRQSTWISFPYLRNLKTIIIVVSFEVIFVCLFFMFIKSNYMYISMREDIVVIAFLQIE